MGKALWRDFEGDDGPDVALIDRPSPVPDVPGELAVVFGAQVGWSRDREQTPPPGRACPTCGSESGPIKPGTMLVCAACLRSGQDRKADELKAKYPPPPPDPKPRARGPKGNITVPEKYAARLAGRPA